MTWRGRWAVRGLRQAVASSALVVLLSCSSAPELPSGETVHGELAVGDSVRYALEIANRRTVRLTVVPEIPFGPPPALRVQVLDPRGWTLAEARVRDPRTGLFAWVTSVGGRHSVRISMAERLERGGYRLDYEVVAAEPDDTWRVTAENREAEAVRAHEQLDLTRAFRLLEESRAAWRRAGDTRREVSTLLDLCNQKSDYEEYRDDALGDCAEALRIARRTDLPDLVPEALTFRGLALKRARRYAEAVEAYREARTSAEEREDWAAAAKAVYNNGTLYLARGDLQRASAELDEALALARRGDANDTLSYAQLAKANLAKRMADPDAAVAWASAATTDAREAGDLFAEAAALQELGNLAQRRGDFSAALGFFEASRDSNEILGDWNKVVDNERSLAVLTLALRGADEALSHYQRALEIARALADPEREAEVLRGMGVAHETRGDLEQAEEYLRASLEAMPDAAAGVRASTLHRLGTVELARGDLETGIDRLVEALDLRQVQDLRGLSLNHRDLGIALTRAERFAEARGHLEKALDLDRDQDDPFRQARTLFRLAELEGAEGDLDRARERIEEALRLGGDIRAALTTDRLKTDLSTTMRALFDFYVSLLLRLAAERPGAGHEATAFDATEESRARGLLELLLQSPEKMRGAIDPELEQQATALERRLSYLSDQLVEARGQRNGQARVREIEAHYEAAEGEWDRIDRQFRELSRAYRSLREPDTLDLAAVQQLLRPEQAILSYWIGGAQSNLFAVTAEGYSVHSLPLSDEIREHTQRLREALVHRLPPSRLAPDALWLYQELITPALGTIGDRRELIVIPDGPLQLVPFAALLTRPPDGGGLGGLPYLLRERSISYAPSVTVLATLASDAGRSRAPAPTGPSRPLRLVVFADPVYAHPPAIFCPEGPVDGALAQPTAAALEASRAEGEGLIHLLGERVSRAFLGAEATEEQLLASDQVRRAERIHFAVHAVVCETRPERSALILALDGDPTEDGLLQVREIFGLSLDADLVVLSGCETGLGKEVNGEGIVGLSRSFLHAGAASVMVTLWPIADRAGAELMLEFYRGLEDGRGAGDKAEALRLAQLEMADRGDFHSHPFFWAPFVVIGARDVPSTQ